MFDTLHAGSGPDVPDALTDDPSVPLERVEAEICELAGHLAAATCRFLVLLGDFDARRGWASWEMTSCAAWLSWKCQMSSGTAREHVRVARALRDLPVIRGEFGAGRLSYAKVRALTRIATPDTEAGLAELAGPMTGNQLERFARAHRQVSTVDDAAARVRRRLAWRFEEDGSLSGTFRLPPLQGAVLLKALRAAVSDPEQPHPSDAEDGPPPQEPGVSAETPAAAWPEPPTSSSLADALLIIAETFLAGKIAEADDAEVYQVIVHVGADATPDGQPAGAEGGQVGGTATVSAETPATVPGHPADPARCHVEDGPGISVTTAQMIGCSASWSWMLHDSAGKLLDLGRRRRRPNAALRRAARERDTCRCRFPGCESRRVDLHHIQYWSNGGRTSLDNLVSLCKYHHLLVHDRGYLIAAARDGTFAFYRPDGTTIPASPPLPEPGGTIGDWHDADITPDTIIPPWYGERLDLDYAIHVCFANARTEQERQAHLQDGEPKARDRVTVYRAEDWDNRIRRYYDEHPRSLYRVIQAIPS
ncbi:MAG TPA: HNH endonuclease signature motif containing protein [Streptosporangiaceae bacterium]|nr:HNH endonuclease signature motif containing protein [Streptosporangiaceae bacterium]